MVEMCFVFGSTKDLAKESARFGKRVCRSVTLDNVGEAKSLCLISQKFKNLYSPRNRTSWDKYMLKDISKYNF